MINEPLEGVECRSPLHSPRLTHPSQDQTWKVCFVRAAGSWAWLRPLPPMAALASVQARRPSPCPCSAPTSGALRRASSVAAGRRAMPVAPCSAAAGPLPRGCLAARAACGSPPVLVAASAPPARRLAPTRGVARRRVPPWAAAWLVAAAALVVGGAPPWGLTTCPHGSSAAAAAARWLRPPGPPGDRHTKRRYALGATEPPPAYMRAGLRPLASPHPPHSLSARAYSIVTSGRSCSSAAWTFARS